MSIPWKGSSEAKLLEMAWKFLRLPPDRLVLRPLLPGDVGRKDWHWEEGENLCRHDSCYPIALTGLVTTGELVSAWVRDYEKRNTLILLVPYGQAAALLIRPNQWFHIVPIRVTKMEGGPYTFALRGYVAEEIGIHLMPPKEEE